MKSEKSNNIRYLKGVGEARAKMFEKLGVKTLEDMIYYFPRDYEDRSQMKKIGELFNGEPGSFKAMVSSSMTEMRPRKGLTIQKLIVRDDTGSCVLTWFNQSYLKDIFKRDSWFVFYGKPIKKYGHVEIQNPVYEKLDNNTKETGRIVPIYPSTSNLTQKVIRGIIRASLDMVNNQLTEFISEKIRTKYNLAEINYAINNIHFPKDFFSFNYSRKRLVFEELLILQLGLLSMKSAIIDQSEGISFKKFKEVTQFIQKLPFELTQAQSKVLDEILEDMGKNRPMNRLIQGDVGCGKTIVVAIAMYKAVLNGYQTALMVPTGILAEQHYQTFMSLFDKLGINIVLVTGSLTKKQKENIQNEISNGNAQMIIGTHALIEEGIYFKNLGLVVTDEQHRFGVRQRALLASKGQTPDVIVMTATPIPRTLALILYGDLDISIIDQLPPGRRKIETYWIEESMRKRMNGFIKKEIVKGRQIYVVCPLVEESDTMDLKSAQKHADELKKFFKEYRIEFLHGRMKNSEKDTIMKEFVSGDINILVSTTVIEVGVNVPNSSVMVIENAERFGLAQLHQLRGRVGRGMEQSYCILITGSVTEITKERMRVMQNTGDGFIIAEKDLELRGPGEFFGTRQHGLPDLRIANLFGNIEVLKLAQETAKEMLEEDSKLEKPENLAIKEKVLDRFQKREEEIVFN